MSGFSSALLSSDNPKAYTALPDPGDVHTWLANHGKLTVSRLAIALRLCARKVWPGGEENHDELSQAVSDALKSASLPGLGQPLPRPRRQDKRKNTTNHERSSKSPIRVFTDYALVRRYLRSKLFVFVEDEKMADVLFLVRHIKNFLSIPTTQLVSQYPYEGGLVRKDLLPQTVRRGCFKAKDEKNGKDRRSWVSPRWWNPTFDLTTESHFFLEEFEHRNENGDQGNTWIIKAAQSSHARNYTITRKSTVACSVAMARPDDADQVAQLYVDRPLLVKQRKFDLRFFVLVRSFDPLDVYIHPYHYGRLAPKPWKSTWNEGKCDATESAGSDGSHFTTHTSETGERLLLGPEELVEHAASNKFSLSSTTSFGLQTWKEALDASYQCLSELFSGIGPLVGEWPCSRAYYGCDILFEVASDGRSVVPKLLEVNFQGDLAQIGAASGEEVLSNVLDDIFLTLFTENVPSHMIPIKV